MTNLPTKCTLCNVSCFHIPTHYQYSHPSHFCDGCRRPFVSPSQRQGHICQPSSSPSKCLKPQTPAEETVAGLSATLAKDQACRAEEKSQNTLVQSLSKETHDPSTTTVAANTTHDEGIRVTIPAPTFVDVLIAYFLDELKNKHELKTDPANDPRAMQRLRKGSERVQLKLLEASQALLEIDNLFESIDFICLVTRATFEEPQASNYNPYSQGTVTNEHLSDIYSTAVAAPNSGTAEHEPGSWPEHAAVSLSGAAIADNSKLQATVNSPVDSESVASSLSDCDMLSEFYNVLSSADVSAPSSPLQISERLPHSSEDTGVDPLAFNSNGGMIHTADESIRSGDPEAGAKEHITISEDVLTVSNIIPILTCRVCSVKTSQLIITSCGHLFCHRCIMEQLSKDLKCPVCDTFMLTRLQVG